MKKKGLTDIITKGFEMWTLNENVCKNIRTIHSYAATSIILHTDSHDFNSNYDLIRP